MKKPKKGLYMPVLTDEEKAARGKRARKDREQFEAKNAQSLKDFSKEFADHLKDSETLVVSEELQKLMDPLEVEEKAPLIKSPNDLSKVISEQSQLITDRIEILETELALTQMKVAKLEKISKTLENERDRTQQLITRNDKAIAKNLQHLLNLDSQEFQHVADRSWVVRLLADLLGNPDEVLTKTRLAKNEALRLNRLGHISKLEAQLSDVTITIVYHDQMQKAFRKGVENFRSLHVGLSQTYRIIKDQLQETDFKTQQQKINQAFQQNLQTINRVGDQMKKFVKSARKSSLFDFEQIQTAFLLPGQPKDFPPSQADPIPKIQTKNPENS